MGRVLEKAIGTAGSPYRNREISTGLGGSPYRKEGPLVQGLGSASSEGRQSYRDGGSSCRKQGLGAAI